MKRTGVRLFAFVLGVYLLLAPGHLHNQDAGYELGVAISIVRDGSFESRLGGRLEVPGVDGRKYIEYPIGQSLLYVPAVLAGEAAARLHPELSADLYSAFFASFVSPIVSALGVLAFFVLVASLGFSARVSALLALVLAFATIAWPYAHDSFDISTASTFLVLSLALLVRGRNSGRLLPVTAAGLALGFGVLVRLPSVLAIPFAALYLLSGRLRLDRPAALRLAAFLLPLGFAGAVVLWYNWVRFGDPFSTGYEGHLQFSGSFWEGLAGPLVSPGKSLFLYSPPLLLALYWFPAFLRVRPREGLLFLAIVLANLLFHARLTFWAGDWAWGPRYMVPPVPLLLAPLAILLARWRAASPRARRTAVVVVGLGVAVQMLAVAADYQMQLALLTERGDWDRRVWSPGKSPLVWQARMAVEIARGAAPLPRERTRRPGGSPERRNTFDFWWVHLWHLRIARAAVAACALGLVLFASVTGFRLRRVLEPA